MADRYWNEKVFLTCLTYLRYTNVESRIYETFFDSTDIKGRLTDQAIGKSIVEIMDKF